jgi:RNA polymerase-binding protein DksA
MSKQVDSQRKSVRKTIVAVAKRAKKSAKSVLTSGRTIPKPVEIEPRPLESSSLRRLKRERRRLEEELTHQELLAQERPATGNHMADDASEVEEQSKAFALRRHLEGMIQEIDRAIALAEKGTYGVCERCHRPISDERLKVMPSATLCIDCAKLVAHPTKVPLHEVS